VVLTNAGERCALEGEDWLMQPLVRLRELAAAGDSRFALPLPGEMTNKVFSELAPGDMDRVLRHILTGADALPEETRAMLRTDILEETPLRVKQFHLGYSAEELRAMGAGYFEGAFWWVVDPLEAKQFLNHLGYTALEVNPQIRAGLESHLMSLFHAATRDLVRPGNLVVELESLQQNERPQADHDPIYSVPAAEWDRRGSYFLRKVEALERKWRQDRLA
jgi:hypothetical protein